MKRSTTIGRSLFAAAAITVGVGHTAVAAPLADLSGAQTGRIEFTSATPAHRWALIRGNLGPEVTVFGDLLMPSPKADGKVPAVAFSHSSEGVSSLYFNVFLR